MAVSKMWYRIAADLVLVAHLLFIGFVVGGAFLAWRWPRIIWAALPAMVYGALVEFAGFTCPLPRIALLRTSIPDVSRSDIDDPEKLARVRAFRDEVAREVRPAEFPEEAEPPSPMSTGAHASTTRATLSGSNSGQPFSTGAGDPGTGREHKAEAVAVA